MDPLTSAAIAQAAISGVGSIVGGSMSQAASDKAARMNIKYQKEFAKSGIKWRVKDARDAGIHPLYALGAQTTSFSPISVGGSPMGEAIAQTGQDLGRAVGATMTSNERANTVYTKALQTLQLQRGGLENEKLAAEIASLKRSMAGPPFPGANFLIPGQSGSALVNERPMTTTAVTAANPHQEPAAVPEVGYGRTASGYAPIPSEAVKQRIEDMLLPELTWFLRNQVLPTIGLNQSPPPVLGDNYYYHPLFQEYRKLPARRGKWYY